MCFGYKLTAALAYGSSSESSVRTLVIIQQSTCMEIKLKFFWPGTVDYAM